MADPPQGFYRLAKPEFDGIEAEVQHPASKGAETRTKGRIGLATISAPDGSSKVVMNIVHSDGTSLTAILTCDDCAVLSGIWMNKVTVAVALERGQLAQPGRETRQ